LTYLSYQLFFSLIHSISYYLSFFFSISISLFFIFFFNLFCFPSLSLYFSFSLSFFLQQPKHIFLRCADAATHPIYCPLDGASTLTRKRIRRRRRRPMIIKSKTTMNQQLVFLRENMTIEKCYDLVLEHEWQKLEQ